MAGNVEMKLLLNNYTEDGAGRQEVGIAFVSRFGVAYYVKLERLKIAQFSRS